jgi:8-hydroxy-5-deazaflavin:NADPH oxidoreductase
MFGGGESAQEAAAREGGLVGTNADAVDFAGVIILAVPFSAVGGALAEAGPLDDRVLWSCVNATKPDLSGLALGFETSGAEAIAARAHGARFVAAIPPFANAIASGTLSYDAGLEPTVFVCGDDDGAKRVVEELIEEIGAQPVDAGPLSAARLVEPAMMLLVSLAYSGVPRDIGLRLLERTGDAQTQPEGGHP